MTTRETVIAGYTNVGPFRYTPDTGPYFFSSVLHHFLAVLAMLLEIASLSLWGHVWPNSLCITKFSPGLSLLCSC